jgi:glyoxylase-like metal-dependent hydrolase (beta-lactamase superfamily II)
MIDYRVISIGALSHHPLRQEAGGRRTAHATTTLIQTEGKRILVDPALPAEVLNARLVERSGLELSSITDVFLTNFRPAHRGALLAMSDANWLISEAEREQVGVSLIELLQRVDEDDQDQVKHEIAILKRCKAAPDKLAQQVDLFPLPGFTPGTCGLLLPLPGNTVLIAGDAVATQEHFEQGKVLEDGWDVEQARASLTEAIEIADWLICGHDNLIPNTTRQGF